MPVIRKVVVYKSWKAKTCSYNLRLRNPLIYWSLEFSRKWNGVTSCYDLRVNIKWSISLKIQGSEIKCLHACISSLKMGTYYGNELLVFYLTGCDRCLSTGFGSKCIRFWQFHDIDVNIFRLTLFLQGISQKMAWK